VAVVDAGGEDGGGLGEAGFEGHGKGLGKGRVGVGERAARSIAASGGGVRRQPAVPPRWRLPAIRRPRR
jgi:hypothetical protein